MVKLAFFEPYRKVGNHMETLGVVLPYLLQQRALESPDRRFLRELDGPSRTFGDVYDAARLWSDVLAEQGVDRGDFVAAMLPNGILTTEVWLGINGLGAVEVPIHTDYRGRLLVHVLNTAGAKCLVIAEQFAERLAEIASSLTFLESVIIADMTGAPPDLPFEIHAGDDVIAKADKRDPVLGLRDGDVSTTLFTSGTTGASKGVLIPYGHLRASTEGAWPAEHLRQRDVNYVILPNFHISSKVAIFSMLAAGGGIAFRERFSTTRFWEDIKTAGATCTCLMGAMAAFLMSMPEQPEDADTTLDKVLLLPLPASLPQFRKRFNLSVRTIYNQTEISVPVSSPAFDAVDYESCGQLRDGYECRLVDADDRPVEVGELGELIVRAAVPWTMMAGYIGQPEKTVELMRNQWIHTGDLLRVDAGGNYRFVDRLKDVIRRRGENISSVEVEEAVCDHDDVIEAAAIPVSSEWTEDEVKVFVICKPGSTLSPEKLIEYLEPRMPRFMIPRYVEFVSELPKTPTQKVQKAELRKLGVTGSTWDRLADKEAALRAETDRKGQSQ